MCCRNQATCLRKDQRNWSGTPPPPRVCPRSHQLLACRGQAIGRRGWPAGTCPCLCSRPREGEGQSQHSGDRTQPPGPGLQATPPPHRISAAETQGGSVAMQLPEATGQPSGGGGSLSLSQLALLCSDPHPPRAHTARGHQLTARLRLGQGASVCQWPRAVPRSPNTLRGWGGACARLAGHLCDSPSDGAAEAADTHYPIVGRLRRPQSCSS